jgi:hypothetical protein
MKYVLSALAAVTLLVGVAASQPAEARCFWNGFETVCVQRHHYWMNRPHFYTRDFGPRPYWWGGY